MSSNFLLQVSSLTKCHHRRPIFRDICLELESGSCTLLTGKNGAGKSTLLRILSGLEKPDQGLFSMGHATASPWKKAKHTLQRQVMYLHQQPYLFDGSVEYNLGFALPRRMHSRERSRQIDQALDWIGMTAFRQAPARSLSGGERQRLALARGWLGRPRIMLLDEPTANLDREARNRTLELLLRLRKEGMTLVIASHDPYHFRGLPTRNLHLAAGQLRELETPPMEAVQSAQVIPIRRDFA